MRKKRHKIILLLLVACFFTSFSQNPATKKKVKSLLKDAQFYFDGEDYASSWKYYRQTLAIDSMNELAGVNAAICAVKLNYNSDSSFLLIGNLKASKQIDSKYYLAKIRHQQRAFNEALGLLDEYMKTPVKERLHTDEEASYLTGMCISARSLTSNPKRISIKNMGPNINSAYADYVPVIAPDESSLYFTSKREGSSKNKKNGDNSYFEDIYVSHHTDNNWTKAENIGEPINTETNEACVAISPDGQKMIVFRTSADELSGDLYLTKLGKNGKWDPLEIMTQDINSPYIETSACFSSDTSEIFFSSNRPGGLGGKDIYRIKKLPNGRWSVALNLGSTVNTIYDDDAPFLHPDGITLYYSSKGHNTMGEYDVFKSVWNEDDMRFSTSENLGYPINDVGNDIFFVLSVDGQRGYYSSIKEETLGGIDIYQIDTRFGENESKVEEGYAFIEGVPGRVKITLTDKETNEITGIFCTNPETGRFLLITNPLKSYKVLVEGDDCQSIHTEIKPLSMGLSSHYLDFKLKKSNGQ